ncbi:MAG: hypothetical protein KF687_14635 [Cyclobacteriaceae bacterium]|nr:hypothetical protein [Cyclobacteriaceae bacterium]
MKKYVTILFVLISHLELFAQVVDLSKAASERKLVPVEYDGSYLIPDLGASKEMKAGLAGHEITIVKISSEYSLKDVNGKYATYKDLKEIEGKTWVIKEFINEGYSGKYLIENQDKQWITELGMSDTWFLNKGLEKLKENFVNKKFNSFIRGLEVQGIDETNFKLDGITPLTVTDLQYAKISYSEYSVALFFDNGLISAYDPSGITQPRDEGWIMIGGKYGSDLLVEESALNKYSAANSRFIKQMRDGKVEVGMTEYQTRLSWGIPQKSYSNISGYDTVNDYGHKTLYFKKDILQLIK